MQAYQENISAKVNGVLTPILGVKVTVTNDSTGNPATLFSDNGVTQITGDIITDETGYFGFFAANGSYTVSFSSPQIRLAPRNIDLYDPLDDAPLTQSQAASPSGASRLGFGQRTVENKLGDVVSVKDKGVVSDGTTGVTAILFAALTALGSSSIEVLLPQGDYLLDSSLTIASNFKLVFQAGARLLIPNGVTLTLSNVEISAGRQQVFKCTGSGKVIGQVRNELIFPEWWGAIADGLHPNVGTDFSDRAAAAARNGSALQAALDFAGYQYSVSGNTGTVSLATGGYASGRELFVPLSTNVIGGGIGCAIFLYAATGNCLTLLNSNNSLVSDVFLAPLAGPTWNFSTGYGLYCKNTSTPCIRNVWSSGFGGGPTTGGTFYFESVIEGRIEGLVSDNSAGPAFTIRGVGQKTVLYGCLTANNVGACFDIQNGYDWELNGCIGKHGTSGTNAFYLNNCENINLIGCGGHALQKEGLVMTASVLNCTLLGFFVNDASMLTSGAYDAISISGTRNKLVAPKVTSNTPQYRYGINLGGGATDCTLIGHNVTAGTLGTVFDQQPIGVSTYHVHKKSTTDATPLGIWLKGINNNAGAYIKATVVGKQRGSTVEYASFEITAFAQTGSTSTTLTTPTVTAIKGNPSTTMAANLVLTTSAGNAGVVTLQVTGFATGNPVDWEAEVKVVTVTG